LGYCAVSNKEHAMKSFLQFALMMLPTIIFFALVTADVTSPHPVPPVSYSMPHAQQASAQR
jgi:hypothetical protein